MAGVNDIPTVPKIMINSANSPNYFPDYNYTYYKAKSHGSFSNSIYFTYAFRHYIKLSKSFD